MGLCMSARVATEDGTLVEKVEQTSTALKRYQGTLAIEDQGEEEEKDEERQAEKEEARDDTLKQDTDTLAIRNIAMAKPPPGHNIKFCRCQKCKAWRANPAAATFSSPLPKPASSHGRVAYLKGFAFGITFHADSNRNAMQQLLRIFNRERYSTVIWDGDRPCAESYVALLPNIATALPEAKLLAGKRAKNAQSMKEDWMQFIAATGSPMQFGVHEVRDAAFADDDWATLGRILQEEYGPGDVHFFGGGEHSLKQLAMMADAGEGTVYSYDVVRKNNGRCEESSQLHTVLKNCPETQEDGAGVFKLTRVRALSAKRGSAATAAAAAAVMQGPAAVQNP